MTAADDEGLLLRLIQNAQAGRPAGAAAACTDYAWSVPHRFPAQQRQRLEKLAASAGDEICRRLAGLLRTELKLTSLPPAEQYAPHVRALPAADVYRVALSSGAAPPCGFLSLAGDVAVGFVERLLGGSDSTGVKRALSNLEAALLLDVMWAMAAAVAQAVQAAGGPALSAGKALVETLAPAPGVGDDPLDEFCVLAYCLEGSEQPAVVVALPCALLEAAAGAAAQSEASTDELRKTMQAHLGQASVRTEAWLGSAPIAVRELMALENGDVLLLGRQMGEPVQVMAGGNKIAAGTMARSRNCYAVKVADR